MAEKLLEVKNLRTEFKRDKTWVTAVNNVSFSIERGEILGLVGESGCGKSVTSLSVMRLLARNSKISNGEVILNGTDLLKEDKKGMRNIRGREVAMIFQEPMNSLNPCMKIEKQLTEAILLHNDFTKEQAHQRAYDVLKSVGIPEPDMTLKSYPHQLSGGMCQRVMIAMAMSCVQYFFVHLFSPLVLQTSPQLLLTLPFRRRSLSLWKKSVKRKIQES